VRAAAGAWLAAGVLLAAPAGAAEPCGEVVTVETHGRTTTRYALAGPPEPPPAGGRVALVLLPGGGGHLDLDAQGCPRALAGNSLVRKLPLLHGAGFVTALVDAPSDHPGDEGLGGFRVTRDHADDLGRVIADVRRRTRGPVWLIGTSRGAISAANAAARLAASGGPDGLVLTSAVMSGGTGGQRPYVRQTVFDADLEAIRVPVLVVGHAADSCLRSPATMMERITARTSGAREQVVTVTGGPGGRALASLDACQGRSPHGFVDQEAEVVAGIARFIRGERY